MKKFIRSVGGKTVMFVCTVLALLIFAGCVIGVTACVFGDIYTEDPDEIKEDCFQSTVRGQLYYIADNIAEDGSVFYDRSKTNLRYTVYDENDEIVAQNYDLAEDGNDFEQYRAFIAIQFGDYNSKNYDIYSLSSYGNIVYYSYDYREPDDEIYSIYEVRAYIDEDFPVADTYYYMSAAVDFMHSIRYTMIPVGIVSLIAAIAAFITLMCASGRRTAADGAEDDVHPGVLNKVPFDILLAVSAALIALGISGCIVILDAAYPNEQVAAIAVCGAIAAAMLSIFIGLCMSIAARLKQGTLIKNTLIAMTCCIIWRCVKAVWSLIKRFFRFVVELLRSIPMIWKTSLVLAGVIFIEFIFICACWWETDILLLWWIIEKMIMTPVIMYSAICLRRLQKAGEALAAGELGYKADIRGIFWDLKRHAENLNSIADGMSLAVDERMKSERMKTELITNVSHDIKTPLTSIINYVDLISREECDNEKIAEYTEVLSRQSARLKRLIEDLVEASKAATGNLEVVMSMCDANVFISQTAGEYEHRLNEAGLQIIVSQPEDTVYVMADGRRMFRVFDNLMNNICKYAQGGTRVYLSLERAGENAVITFKNVSREPLNISADELMERFVRGDSSRNTEGSGLGLSIAKSLTELQGGTLELSVDGDLFKAILTFPVVQ